jgi:S-formylglutathione hydrolase FrmB
VLGNGSGPLRVQPTTDSLVFVSQVRRLLVGVAASLALAATAAAPAPAAQRVEVVDLPSLAGNVDLSVARLNKATKLQAHVLLPDGYDEQPERRWPVLYLLHGVGDDSSTWLDPKKGDVRVRAKGLPAIVVMPEGGRNYFTDLWLGGSRKGGNWERYTLGEVLPAIEARYRIAPGRDNHAIGGLSAGAYGASLLGAQLPSYFGTVLNFSGLFNLEDPSIAVLVPYFSAFSFTRQWGRFGGPYARAHSPLRLIDNLQASRVYVSAGNGLGSLEARLNAAQALLGGVTEAGVRVDSEVFARTARSRGVEVAYRPRGAGVHYWPYWRRELSAAIQWGLFERPARDAAAERTQFRYLTMAPHGNAWGLGFRFAAPPTTTLLLRRDGQHLTATGRGTITITPGAADADASGAGTRTDCAFTAELPFERELPAGC